MVDQVIKLKRNTSNTTAPTTSDIVVGEIAISAVDGKLYIRKQDVLLKTQQRQLLELLRLQHILRQAQQQLL